MSGLDTLVAKSLRSTINKNLGQKTLQRVEQRLFERYGINITQSIEEFHKLDSVLKEFFGAGTDALERQFLQPIVTLDTTKNKDRRWVSIEDPTLAKIILESFGDDDKKNILNTVLGESKIISDILDTCNIPQTSGYRKVNSLILDGLLTIDGFTTTHDGKKVNKYKSLFENVQISIEKNSVVVKVQLANDSLKRSSIIQVLHG